MYSTRSNLVLGFHGCDENIAHKIILQEIPFKISTNKYDWLGEGMYFWENSPARAYQFINDVFEHPQNGKAVITKPCVIGAVIDLGKCLNLTDYYSLLLLKDTYNYYVKLQEESGWEIEKM